MAKCKTQAANDMVSHPRYGTAPISSGVVLPEAEIRRGHWDYDDEVIYPESVLIADASKQNYSMYPRKYYVDMLKTCRGCKRPFIFFAREQKHWFETLRFYVDADCVHCPECRRNNQTLRRRLRRYSDLQSHGSPSLKDLMDLVDDGLYLFERGVLRNLSRLGQLKNAARKRIAEYPGTEALEQAIERAHRPQT